MPAIIFDFDGTLVDTEPIHERALRVAAESRGAAILEGETIGLADEDALERSLTRAGVAFDDRTIREACRDKTAAYLRLIEHASITVYDGAVGLVREAAQRGPIAICTAAVRAEVLPVLGRIGLEGAVDVLVCADDVAAKKPDPAGYLECAARLGLGAAECVVVEDSPRGVAAARAAGCLVYAVGHTTPPDRLREAHRWAARIAELDVDTLLALAHGGDRVQTEG